MDLYQTLYPNSEKNKSGNPVGKCPECGKEVVKPYLNQTKFCSLICETNYRYRMKRTGNREPRP